LEHEAVIVDPVIVRAFGGYATGLSPVDRGKSGTKHTPLVSRTGVLLANRTTKASARDQRRIIPLVLMFPEVGGKPGRPRELPDGAYADRGFDSEATREFLRWLGIEPHILKQRSPHGSGLGKFR
jgi:hypothetical protein